MEGSTISLALSLLFGVGQVLVGGGFAWYGATRQRWRRPRVFVVALVGAWFFCSGLVELFVSGMESLQHLSGSPDAATFATWRSRADMVLLIWTIGLAIAGLAYLAVNWQNHSRRT
jgi:ABC-type enterobactin transport system permease subunit